MTTKVTAESEYYHRSSGRRDDYTTETMRIDGELEFMGASESIFVIPWWGRVLSSIFRTDPMRYLRLVCNITDDFRVNDDSVTKITYRNGKEDRLTAQQQAEQVAPGLFVTRYKSNS